MEGGGGVSDETLYLTQCCSVKVKPYRMSEMMTRTERFHLIPPFPLFSAVPAICRPHLHLWPPRSLDETDIYRPSPTLCIKPVCGYVQACLCVQTASSPAIPPVRQKKRCLRPKSLCLHGGPGFHNPLSTTISPHQRPIYFTFCCVGMTTKDD